MPWPKSGASHNIAKVVQSKGSLKGLLDQTIKSEFIKKLIDKKIFGEILCCINYKKIF